MENRRKAIRFTTQVKAHYLFEGEKEWKECTITEISGRGLRITCHHSEHISYPSIIYLEAFFSALTRPTQLEGALKWCEKKEDECVSGIELHRIVF